MIHTDSRINRMKNLLLEAKRKIEGPLLSPKLVEEHILVRSETERLKSQRQLQMQQHASSTRVGGVATAHH